MRSDPPISNPTYQQCADTVANLFDAQTPLQDCSDAFDVCMTQGQGTSPSAFAVISDIRDDGHDGCYTTHGTAHPGCHGN